MESQRRRGKRKERKATHGDAIRQTEIQVGSEIQVIRQTEIQVGSEIQVWSEMQVGSLTSMQKSRGLSKRRVIIQKTLASL